MFFSKIIGGAAITFTHYYTYFKLSTQRILAVPPIPMYIFYFVSEDIGGAANISYTLICIFLFMPERYWQCRQYALSFHMYFHFHTLGILAVPPIPLGLSNAFHTRMVLVVAPIPFRLSYIFLVSYMGCIGGAANINFYLSHIFYCF